MHEDDAQPVGRIVIGFDPAQPPGPLVIRDESGRVRFHDHERPRRSFHEDLQPYAEAIARDVRALAAETRTPLWLLYRHPRVAACSWVPDSDTTPHPDWPWPSMTGRAFPKIARERARARLSARLGAAAETMPAATVYELPWMGGWLIVAEVRL